MEIAGEKRKKRGLPRIFVNGKLMDEVIADTENASSAHGFGMK
jgi:hypothetical protein